MQSIETLEAKMTNMTFTVGQLFEEVAKIDKSRALAMIGRLSEYLNDIAILELKKDELKKEYDMGLLTTQEYTQRLSWL